LLGVRVLREGYPLSRAPLSLNKSTNSFLQQ